MSVSTVFEVHATEDEPIRALLEEVRSLPIWERELATAHIMRHEADRRAERAAGALAILRLEEKKQERARATRAERSALTTDRQVEL